MGSPIVRALVASDRYSMPDEGPVEPHMEAAVKILREVRSQVMDSELKIGIENHKDLHAWQTREIIESAGKEFVGSYLDTGNPVFVAEHPLTTVEELGPLAVTFHLRDSVVDEHPLAQPGDDPLDQPRDIVNEKPERAADFGPASLELAVRQRRRMRHVIRRHDGSPRGLVSGHPKVLPALGRGGTDVLPSGRTVRDRGR